MRAIDADAMIDRLKEWDTKDKTDKALYNFTLNRINEQPTIQPEIVRCKDCKHWDTTWQNDYAPNYHYCPMIDGTHRNDFYCAYAERRTDGRFNQQTGGDFCNM